MYLTPAFLPRSIRSTLWMLCLAVFFPSAWSASPKTSKAANAGGNGEGTWIVSPYNRNSNLGAAHNAERDQLIVRCEKSQRQALSLIAQRKEYESEKSRIQRLIDQGQHPAEEIKKLTARSDTWNQAYHQSFADRKEIEAAARAHQAKWHCDCFTDVVGH